MQCSRKRVLENNICSECVCVVHSSAPAECGELPPGCTSGPTTKETPLGPLWVGTIWAWMDIPAGGLRISAAFVSHCSAAWPPLSCRDPVAVGTNPRLFWTTRARPVRSAHQPHSMHHTSDKASGCWGPGGPAPRRRTDGGLCERTQADKHDSLWGVF